MNETMGATKWWFGWEPEKIEKWLEEKEAEGWHLLRVNGMGVKFDFVKGEPRRIRYCADYQSKQDPAYKSIFQDTGWALAYEGMGWYIWRMEYEGERPEIYTEVDSLLERNKKLVTALSVVVAAQLPMMTVVLTSPALTPSAKPIFASVYAVLLSFVGYALYKYNMSSNHLKAKKKEL